MPRPVEVRLRNALRRLGVEVVPTRRRTEVNLLGLHLSRLLPQLGIDVVLDVGARVGEYGRWLRDNGYRGRIVSFEPVSAHLGPLRAAAAADPAWTVVPCALGDRDGVADISVARMSQLSSLLPVSDYGRSFPTEAVRAERVQVRRLDTVWPELPRGRTYLKLDTQGYDLQVLAGAGARLDEVLALQTEAAVQRLYDGAPTHLETLVELDRLGFTPSGLFPVTLDDGLRLVEYDCVAVRSPG